MKKVLICVITLFVLLNSFAQTKPKPKPPTPAPVSKAVMDRGKKVYDLVCIACHQADGGGMPPMNPPLIKTKWVLGNKKELVKIVLKGLKGGEIEIDGDTFNNPMPALETTLNDQQIADVLTYVRNNFGNKASVVTVAEVKAGRGVKK
jgi:mono/diheme cytochrome c family protein